jgi:hypothetical protein
VIVDDTNLKSSVIEKFITTFKSFTIKFKVFDVDLDTACSRDRQRACTVGSTVIEKQMLQFKELQKLRTFQPLHPITELQQHEQNLELPPAFVFDVDGTLANNSRRSPFAWSEVQEDTVIAAARDCAIALWEAGFPIIICTGRDGCCAKETVEWLHGNGIPVNEFHIRTEGDTRADTVVKEEFWKDISTRYRIEAMFDDRNSVVQHARSLGYTVYQVANGAF